MSTGTTTSPRRSRALVLLNILGRFSGPLRRTILAFVIAVITATAIWTGMVQRQSRLLAEGQKIVKSELTAVAKEQQLTKEQINALQTLGVSDLKQVRQDVEHFREELTRIEEQSRLLRTEVNSKTAEMASSRARTTQVRARAIQASEYLKRLRGQLVKWNTAYVPLLENESGRRIASKGEFLTLALSTLQRERPQLSDVDAWGQALDEYLQPLELAFKEKDGVAVVAAEQEAGIDKIRSDVGRALSQVDADVLVLDTLLKDAEQLDPGQLTIRQVIDHRLVEQAKTLANELETARAAAVAEKTAALKAEECALEATRIETAIHKLRNEQRVEDTKRTADDAETKRRIEEVKRLQAKQDMLKEFERDLPQIRSYLSAFISSGRQYRKKEGEGPVSLSLITSKGTMAPSGGLSVLSFLANVNDRSAGALKNPAGYDQVQKAQDLLKKYADLLVEKGMLDE